MNNGFIYPIAKKLVEILWYLNLVEHFKLFSIWVYKKNLKHNITKAQKKEVGSFAIDIFQLLKWLFLLIVIIFSVTSPVIKYVIFYLIATNLFTYFYYHVWGSSFDTNHDVHSQRRRFVNFLLSICFYLICYSYLYQFQYMNNISWPQDGINTTNAIYLSIANAFTLTYEGFQPLTQTARVLFASELINTFFFFTIIITNSVPNNRN